jgi:hypothetical protein|tara:strand:- start:739 stop:1608 length:870 start_codon:yes stop_codon:yes gene_type:complete
MVFIYVLQCNGGKYYVGKTDNPKFRLDSHFKNGGCAWTKKYKPCQIIGLFPDCDNFDEDKYTLKYMSKYCINDVRGGSFCQVNLSMENKKTIERMISSSNDCCHFCGEKGHFIGNCDEKKLKRKYSKQNNHFLQLSKDYESADEVDYGSDDEEWQCSYCNKGFDTKKGAQFHENVHCKAKKQSEESDEEITLDNIEQSFVEADKEDGIYEFDGNKYLWCEGELYEESRSKTPKKLLKYFEWNGLEYDYGNYNWKSIHEKIKKGGCHKCGRKGHYASNCYAKKHINGYYL